MSVVPRKEEIAAVIALLESDSFDSSRDMAAQVIKTVADVLAVRTTRGVAVGMPGKPPALAIGPFYTLADAKRTVRDAQEAGLEARMARLGGTGSIEAAQVLRRACVQCSHPIEMHIFVTCAVAKCDCQEGVY